MLVHMIAMWIIIGAAVAAVATTVAWRLRKANATLSRILLEERIAVRSEPETLPTSHDR